MELHELLPLPYLRIGVLFLQSIDLALGVDNI